MQWGLYLYLRPEDPRVWRQRDLHLVQRYQRKAPPLPSEALLVWVLLLAFDRNWQRARLTGRPVR